MHHSMSTKLRCNDGIACCLKGCGKGHIWWEERGREESGTTLNTYTSALTVFSVGGKRGLG